MLITTLIILNIPAYLFLAWVVFDTKEAAADTFFETIVALLRIIFIPRIFRVLLDMDDTEAFGLFPIALFLAACGLLIYGEYLLIKAMF